MPKAQIPHGYARAVMHGTYGPASWVNVQYFLVTPADGKTSAEVVADIAAYQVDFYNKIGYAEFPDGWQTTYTSILYIDEDGSLNKARVADVNAGTDSDGSQDAQVAYLINYSVDDGRRGGKARQYVPGVPNSNMADSANLTADSQGTINGGLTTWMAEGAAGFGDNETQLVIVEMSFVNAGVDVDPPVGYPINGLQVNPVVATQRRRVDRLRPT